jgi:transporter family-2 protein
MLITVLAGMTSALQSGSNQMLQKSLGTPLWCIAIVSGVTLVTASLVATFWGGRLPSGGAVAQAPWWAWIGGLFGIGFVLGTVYASPKLGAGLFMALLVTAEVTMSLVLDHFGLMGFKEHRAGIARIAGGLMMVGGVALIAAF